MTVLYDNFNSFKKVCYFTTKFKQKLQRFLLSLCCQYGENNTFNKGFQKAQWRCLAIDREFPGEISQIM